MHFDGVAYVKPHLLPRFYISHYIKIHFDVDLYSTFHCPCSTSSTSSSIYLAEDLVFGDAAAVDTTMSSSSTSAEHDEDLPRGPISSKRFFFSPHATKSIMEEAKPELGTRKVLALGNTLSMKAAFYDESVTMTMSSEDPYQDFRASMEEMVVAHELKEWDSLQELPNWYLRLNERKNRKVIVLAFVDLLMHLMDQDEEVLPES
ncbi:unnamed protein product [Musa acuminata subsp. malaccensis]|uniref:Transcription repressor n=1 Tax=Musa acuminata subsp. malaccensis TaxID=214687 RepID=A0A804IT21_MUSAM|nr:PREDICTED: transcription repressor OFP13-like [Musa acuminata subsp. malaccensis]CAG1843164.1 unnamed protein product [Musa acuminata subsp. malaccensis]